jgi:hypothetical protein
MSTLQRINYRPNTDALSERERESLTSKFDAASTDVIVNGEVIPWSAIEEIEVAVAARLKGASGWIVKKFVMGGDRFHVAFYFGRQEAVLINLTLEAAAYVVKSAAYYAPRAITYTGPEGLAPLSEI